MVNKGVVFMAGHFCSGSSIPASAVYDEEGIVQISPASTNPKLTDEGGPGTYRVCGRDDQQGIVAGNYIVDNFPGARIALLHDKTAYGKGLADETRKQLQKRGVEEAMYEAYTAGEKDYAALVSKMRADKIDVIYVGGYHTEAGLILRQARDRGLQAQLISGDALVTQEYWQITGSVGEGTLMTFSLDPRYVLYTYGAVQAWAQAAEKAGTTDFDKMVEALNANQFSTVLGDIGFDDKGDVTAPGYVFYVWSNGSYDYVQ
ncbi:Leu/Ile/Val-binding protein homolog 1 [Geodia barretti]|uniref:Leu/Ile/Val-binding protein homolog 1 n=1 Tax=Geodia barretti TaxID=519541 RepID=A0AA35WR26_GEOBA|nr:Leu/Ile/Val-binding protein homolog 1 [Geodia barretti]